MEKIPGYMGHIVLTEDGAIINSGGELENREEPANILYNIVHAANKKDITPNEPNDSFKRISIHYANHVYLVTLSNRKIYIVKKKHIPLDPVHV